MKNTLKIAIDARPLSVKGGSRTYLTNLLNNFTSRPNLVLIGVKNYLDYECVPVNSDQQNPFFRLIWENIQLPRLLSKEKVDVFHGTKGVTPIYGKYKKIVTVHDLISLRYPKFYNFLERFYWSKIVPIYIKKADKIIAVSQATKRDLVELLRIVPEKISVVYEGYATDIYYQKPKEECVERVATYFQNVLQKNLTGKKFILNVNTISIRKNLVNLIKAFNRIASRDQDVVLIICGRKGWKYKEIFTEYEKSNFKDRIFFLSYVTDELIADLYNTASVFVYPSFYEGFGLPVIEAQACGCPVITSNSSSLSEVADEAAILVDPLSEVELANEISKLLSDNDTRQNLINKGFENIKRFSWKKCAEETWRIYQSL